MLGADRRGRRARRRAFIGDIAIGKADRERLDRALGQPRHHHQHRGRIDAARQKHAKRHIGALMDAHAVGKGGVEPGQRLRLAERQRAVLGQGRMTAPLDDPALAHDHGFPRQYPADPGKDRFAPGGELHLQELVAGAAVECRGNQAGLDQRPRLGGKRKAVRRLGVIERLDAERVASRGPGGRPPDRAAPPHTCRADGG